jgi:DNA-binding HxlR family transcriptional regulator
LKHNDDTWTGSGGGAPAIGGSGPQEDGKSKVNPSTGRGHQGSKQDAEATPELLSVGRALDLLGDRWTRLVLREAFFGVTRYGYFQRNLGIARSVLASRLALLVEMGLLRRVRYRTEPDWYEYRLTRAGVGLFAPALAVKAWADEYLMDESEGLPREIHRHSCGEVLRPVVVCECCGEPATVANCEYQVLPASPPGHTL